MRQVSRFLLGPGWASTQRIICYRSRLVRKRVERGRGRQTYGWWTGVSLIWGISDTARACVWVSWTARGTGNSEGELMIRQFCSWKAAIS